MLPEDRATKLRASWDESGTKQLKMSKRPVADMDGDKLKNSSELVKNIRQRMKHLAEILAHLHRIYFENKDLYGDKFLAFVGNEVVREWPWKDFPFKSEQALKILNSVENYDDISGLQPFEIKNKDIRAALKLLRYEHWTPISFFRDIFHSHLPVDEETYFHILLKYYRVVWITRVEDDQLNIKNRSWRPVDTYDELGIKIISNKAWGQHSESSKD